MFVGFGVDSALIIRTDLVERQENRFHRIGGQRERLFILCRVQRVRDGLYARFLTRLYEQQ